MNERPAFSETTPTGRQALRARWVFPVDRPPLENATVEIFDGRVMAISQRLQPSAMDLGNAAIIPGLINAHTHLELSDLGAPLQPPGPFTTWLRSVIGHRRARLAAATDAHSIMRDGAREALATGTTLVGDIVSADWTEKVRWVNGPRGVHFLELIGLSPDRIESQLTLARAHLQRDATAPLCGHSCGLSPHAPYSVHPELFRELVRLANEFEVPLAMHLAESRAELELLDRGTGEFVEFLRELGAWRPSVIPTGARPRDYLESLATISHPLAIHGNYLSDSEIDFLADCHTISVVYCPRTHAFFGHEPHPWQQLLARGVNVALGTDSRASNPDLNLWNELLFLHRQFPMVAPSVLLGLGTAGGARALGFETEAGSLTPGKCADLAVVQLPNIDSTDPFTLLFHPMNRVNRVMLSGRWLDPLELVDCNSVPF